MNRSLAAVAIALVGCAAPERGPPCDPGTICTVAGSGAAGYGESGEPAHAFGLYLPVDVAVGPRGLYIVDFNNHRVVVLADGVIEIVSGTGEIGDGPEGPADRSAMLHPASVAVDRDRLWIAAWHNYRIKRVELGSGILSDVAGNGVLGDRGDGGAARDAQFDLPSSVAIDREGGVVIVDQHNQVVRRILGERIDRVAGRCVLRDCENPSVNCEGRAAVACDPADCELDCQPGFAGDGGPALDARFAFAIDAPNARAAVAPDGSIYVSESLGHRIRRIDADGVITTFAGTGEAGADFEGPATRVRLRAPGDVAVGPRGEVYIADTDNGCVRVVEDGMLRTIVGRCGEPGSSGDGGDPRTARLDRPYGIDVSPDGTLWIADTRNHRIRMVRPR